MPHGQGERHLSFPRASSLFSRAWRPRFRHFPCRKRSNPLVDAWMQIPLHPADGTILAVGIVVAFLKSGEIHLHPAALEFHERSYVGRYTHRVAISNHRSLTFEQERVTFRWRDCGHGGTQGQMLWGHDHIILRLQKTPRPRRYRSRPATIRPGPHKKLALSG